MSTADPERRTSYDATQLSAEHRRIREMTQALRHTQGLGELARSLRALRATLELHFLTEEAPDGFFDMIRDRSAAHLARVEYFRREHVLLLGETEDVLERVRACVAGPVADAMARARTLAGRLEQHEASESDLLGEAMSTDVGAGYEG